MALFIGFWPGILAHANISSCDAEVSPSQIDANTVSSVHFSLNSSSGQSVTWIKVIDPSPDFALVSTSVNGWSDAGSTYPSDVVLTGGSLDSGNTIYFTISVRTSNNQASGEWNVQASDDNGGANAINCYGYHSISITPQQPAISNLALSNLTDSSVDVSWDTDIPSSSQVDYGTDSSYGNSSRLDSSQVTNHGVTLTGLSANTGYHYKIESTTSDGGDTFSGDNTFLTPIKEASAPNNTNNPAPKAATAPINVPVTNPGDKTPPTISLSPIASNSIFKTAPTFSGTAKDDSAVAAVEYSTDGGKNWLPVNSATGLGEKQVAFSFTPDNLDDGNYSVLARAIDAGGNIASTNPVSIVIDQLPPIVGGTVISLGPQVLQPDSNGIVHSAADIDQKISLSAVGGPTSITLVATSSNSKIKSKSFSLAQSPDNDLWSGIMSFDESGTYNIVANGIDGAGNKTSRSLSTISVGDLAKVVKYGTDQSIANAKVTIYYLERESNAWTVWDGASYSQSNPQVTDKNGNFNSFLPAGTYYLKVSAKGYKTLTSDIFTTTGPTPISATLDLRAERQINLGLFSLSWPNFGSQNINLGSNASSKNTSIDNLVGKTLPDFSFTNTSGATISPINLLGKPTLLSFGSTWSPATVEQLPILSNLQSDKDINVVPIALEQSIDSVDVYDALAGLNIAWSADPNGTLIGDFNVQSLPQNYFVDRGGIVKKIVSGVLSKQQVISELSKL